MLTILNELRKEGGDYYDVDRYVLARCYGLDDVAFTAQKGVLADFEGFCETHIADLVNKSPERGLSVLILAKAWKAKTVSKYLNNLPSDSIVSIAFRWR